MKRIACLILFVIGAAVCYGQHRVTLEECQLLARDNYPVIAQQELIDQLEEFNISNARRNWLPKISLSAMAAYLSEVPEFPSTLNDLFSQLGVNLAAMPNTLYGTTVQIQQAIWDGGLIKAQTEAAKAESEVSRRSWESEMYALTERVNQLYFGSLLLQENIATADLMIEDLQRNYKMLESMAAFGTAEKNDLDMLKVEILGAQQQRAQLASTRTAYIAMLSIMTGLELTAATETRKTCARRHTGRRREPKARIRAARRTGRPARCAAQGGTGERHAADRRLRPRRLLPTPVPTSSTA